MAKNRYAVYARRVDEKHWSDWCKVKTLDRAEEHSEKVRELGFKSKIYDTKEKKTIKKDD